MPSVNGGQGRKNKQVVKEPQKDGGEKEEGHIQTPRLRHLLWMFPPLPWKQTRVSSSPAHRGKPRRSYRAFSRRRPQAPLPRDPFSVLFCATAAWARQDR